MRRSICFVLALSAALFSNYSLAMESAPASRVDGVDTVVEAHGAKLHLKCVGSGQSLVLIEAGLGEPPIESGTWAAVVAAISARATVCLYDRAGLGSSGPPRVAPRQLDDLVSDLARIVERIQPKGRLMLVGHSFGGLIVRAYAAQAHTRVDGIVLVDAAHPRQWQLWLSQFPARQASEPESITRGRTFLRAQLNDPRANPEHIDVARACSDAARLGNLGGTPLIVLTHSPAWRMAELPDALLHDLETTSQTLQAGFTKLSSSSEQRISAHGGHNLQTEDPALVTQAILDLIDQAP